MSQKLLIVEDDVDLARLLATYLSAEGLAVDMVHTAADMRQAFVAKDYDLIVLDLGLPDEDGLSLAHWVRGRKPTPIIMVTGKSDPIDRVVGLELGADDYIGKPVLPRELLARVRAVFRRTHAGGGSAGVAATTGSALFDIDGLSFDAAGRSLTGRDGKPVPLTSGEFDVLATLVEHAGQPVARDDLLERAHGRRWNPLDRAIDQHISNLRVKIERDPASPVLIQTVRGVGYILVTRGERGS